MKYLNLCVLFFTTSFFAACQSDDGGTSAHNPKYVNLGDPFILQHDETYYAYGTNDPEGIEVFTSKDLRTWERPADLARRLALKKEDSYGEKWFWAPEVYRIGNTFYMYYSADEHICVATSNSPLGPFVQAEQKPMLDTEKAIDNSLFVDDDGKAYLYFCRFNDGNNVWVAELYPSLEEIKTETMTKCIHVSQDWELVWPRVNEGAFVVKHQDLYYMTYSANSFESPMYGVGFATSDSPMGPWVKSGLNPILQTPGKLSGTGHSANFYDRNGDLRIVFHAHYSATQIHPRRMHIGTIVFEEQNGKNAMRVLDDIVTPVLK